MAQHQMGHGRGRSGSQIDLLRESELQSSIFRSRGGRSHELDIQSLRNILKQESRIPEEVAEKAIHHVRDHLDQLGLTQPHPNLVIHWLKGLLREQGYDLGEASLQSLELTLGDVEINIYHPVGLGAGANQNPEATSQLIAQRIKTQFAEKRVFQEEVMAAHDSGDLELLHLGAIDRPHDVFLTPDYLKTHGLPSSGSAPAAGPARKAHVLLAHMIRFTHELQNHFAGNIRWGYVNTLLLPYLEDMNEKELRQFVQEMLYEFAQLDVERGGLYRKVILDFDFDLPRQLAGLPALGPKGEQGRTYGHYQRTLRQFNESALDILRGGDFRGNPFHSPRIVYHFNNPKTTWGGNHQDLMEIVFKWGNPCIAFSYYQRDFGPMGRISLNDPDFLKILQSPGMLRGFSSSSLAINLPKLAHPDQPGTFPQRLEALLERAASAHREKRLFISRLMAYGNRGPLQFLRHKMDGVPFLKIDKAHQPMQLIGLAEAAALLSHSSNAPPEVLSRESDLILKNLNHALAGLNRIHKLNMFLSGASSESVAYRFAYLDLRRFGQSFAPFVLRQPGQSHPIYSEGPNILAFSDAKWRDRLRLEGKLHQYFSDHSLTLFSKSHKIDDPSFYHKVYQEAVNAGVSQLQCAPDLQVCMTCYLVFDESHGETCPSCKSSLVSPYGWCQSNFSPVHTWCLGKRSEWKIRRRIDERKAPVQTQLPW